MDNPLQTALSEFHTRLMNLADEAEEADRAKDPDGYQRGHQRGVAHGYRKAAEELDRWIYQGKVPGVGRG